MVKKISRSNPSNKSSGSKGQSSGREEGQLSFGSAFEKNKKAWNESRKTKDTGGGGFGDNKAVCEILKLKVKERAEIVGKLAKLQCGRTKTKTDPKNGTVSGGHPYVSWNVLITEGPATGRKINGFLQVKESANRTEQEALDQVFILLQRLDYDTTDMEPDQIEGCCEEQTKENPSVLCSVSVSEAKKAGDPPFYNAEILGKVGGPADDGQTSEDTQAGGSGGDDNNDTTTAAGEDDDNVNVPEVGDTPLYVLNGKKKPSQTKVKSVNEEKETCVLVIDKKEYKDIPFADLIW